ncbi:hypothetical protein F8M41_014650 [Gigaspora margarita]|uniref:Uncharacterized protein n=1 Tax=Gigaspora margarita TaxID=4874 RepID=A0A8H4ARC9_GIGMA|nr:hypothetical protein F8M41_014650 [Gigaspora margarita]
MNESSYFSNLSKSNRSDYLNQLNNELEHSVPIDPSNIIAISQYQWDSDANSLQILLKLQILPGNNSIKDLIAMKVIETLNDLITNRDATMISKSPKSSNYGFNFKSKILIYKVLSIVFYCIKQCPSFVSCK